jgi:hypothetical protein
LAELLGAVFRGNEVEEGTTFRLVEGLLKPEEGKTYKFTVQRMPTQVRIESETSRKATLATIWPALQAKAGAPLEEVGHYVTMKGNTFALLPWENRQKYELVPTHPVSETIIASGSFGSFSAKVPKFRKNECPNLINQTIGYPIASITDTDPKTVTVTIPEDAIDMIVRYELKGLVKEH